MSLYIDKYENNFEILEEDSIVELQIINIKNKILEIENRLQHTKITNKDELDLVFLQKELDRLLEEDRIDWLEINPEYDEVSESKMNVVINKDIGNIKCPITGPVCNNIVNMLKKLRN